MTAATTILDVFLCFTLLAVSSWRAAARTSPTTPAMSPPTHDELTSSLFVNQLAILHLMDDSSNKSYAAAEMRRESDADREASKRLEKAHGERMDRLLAALEVQQRHTQQVLDTLNSNAVDALTKVEELREEVQEEFVRIAASQAKEQPEEEAAAVPEYFGEVVHNDTLPSLCSGNKILTGTVGVLEVVSEDNYSSGTTCSWNLKFPRRSSVSITWDYIQMEKHSSCAYDWVEVLDVTRNSQSVYGRKLCNRPSSSFIKLLNVELHGTNNLMVNFRSDGSNEYKGFRMLYHAH